MGRSGAVCVYVCANVQAVYSSRFSLLTVNSIRIKIYVYAEYVENLIKILTPRVIKFLE